jgi:hypothetical protein
MSKEMDALLEAMRQLDLETARTLKASKRLEEESRKLLEAVKKLEAGLMPAPAEAPVATFDGPPNEDLN